ncbi:MAG: DUF3786 domain-containing protein [Candidatus Omnitrophota bacterium]
MEYKTALAKAWLELTNLSKDKRYTVRFLSDKYDVDLESGQILSLSCNIPVKEYAAILILHYLIKKLKGLPSLREEWVSFKEFVGGQGYYPAFKKRVIGTIRKKYGQKPEGLYGLAERFRAKKAQLADVSVVLDTFETIVPILITFWRKDEEFGPEANVLFDKSITDIFCTEDIAVLSEIVAHSI